MNVDAINATIKVMRDTQDYQFDMGSFVARVFDESGNHCGTSCCLAGFAYIAETGSKIDHTDHRTDYFTKAKNYLGISNKIADHLFTPDNEGIEQTSIATGIRALETLRDTGEVLWDNGEFGEPSEYYYDDEDK